MLDASDAALVQRDKDLPALSLLLDPSGMAEAVSRAYPLADITAVDARYIRYKPGTSCIVGYKVDLPSGSVDFYARAHNPVNGAKLDKARLRSSVSSSMGGMTTLDEHALILYPFPNDHELFTQPLWSSRQRRDTLKLLLPDRPALWGARIEPLRYKPERRFVARCGNADEQAATLRFYTRGDYRGVVRRHGRFDSRGVLRVAQPIARSKSLRATSLEWLDGPILDDVVRSSEDGALRACDKAGLALAEVHGQRSNLPIHEHCDPDGDGLKRSLDALALLVPSLADRLARVGDAIAAQLSAVTWQSGAALHGDFKLDQIVIVDDCIGVLDLDRSAIGDPRIDLASLRARLEFDVVIGKLQRAQADDAFHALLESYCQNCPTTDVRRLGAFSAAALIRIAGEPFRNRLRDWPLLIEALGARAEDLTTAAGIATDV